jgi:hypothetical protein
VASLGAREVKLAGALVVATMFGVACHRDEPTPAPSAPIAPVVEFELPADLSIELKRTKCLGTCPSYVVKIAATGAVEWEGRDYVDVEGPQRSQVSIDAVRALYTRFDAIGFSTLHDSYNVAVTDLDWAILTLRHGGLSKSVAVRGGDFVDQQNTELVISGINEHLRWFDDEPDEPSVDANGVVVRSDFSESPQHAAAAKAFHALDALAAAIDKAANTAQWIGTGTKKRHR